MTVFQSIATSPSGMPSIEILAPWAMLAIMSRSACGLPDISRPTSKPSVMPSSFWTSAIFSLVTLTVRVAPSFFARSRR